MKLSPRSALLNVLALGVVACTLPGSAAPVPAQAPAQGPIQGSRSSLAVAWNDDARGVGIVSGMTTQYPWQFVGKPIVVGTNSVLACANKKFYILSRSHGTVTAVKPGLPNTRRVFSIGRNSQPVDIVVPGKRYAYITRCHSPRLLRLDLNTGACKEVVDLSMFADPDGNPDLGTMIVHGNLLFIQVRRLNSHVTEGYVTPPYLAVVDLKTEKLVDVDPNKPGLQAIRLSGTFPKHRMQIVPKTNLLLVSATGGFFDAGGIEAIDLRTLKSLGLLIQEDDGFTGADLGPFIMVGRERGYLVFSTDFDLSSHVVPFSLKTGVEPGAEMYVTLGYAIPALEWDRATKQLFVPDGAFGRQGIHIFDTDTNEQLTTSGVQTSGPPTDLLLYPIP